MKLYLEKKAKVAILISGKGSNLEQLILKARNYEVCQIVTDNPDAGGIIFGERYKIPVTVINPNNFSRRQLFHEELHRILVQIGPDFIALAGFMQIIKPAIIKEFWGRLVNIHPSLLPILPGLDTHNRAILEGHKTHGCSVHYVDEGMDTGPLIAQIAIDVVPGEAQSVLASRTLVEEHKLYPWVLNYIAQHKIYLENGKVIFDEEVIADATQYKIKIFN